MHTPKKGGFSVSDTAADLRTVYGPGARKRLARDAGASVETVKKWFSEGVPLRRRRQIAEVLLRHIDQQERRLSEIRSRALDVLREPQE